MAWNDIITGIQKTLSGDTSPQQVNQPNDQFIGAGPAVYNYEQAASGLYKPGFIGPVPVAKYDQPKLSNAPVNNPSTPPPAPNPYSGAEDAARSQAQAELEAAMNEFNYQKENLQAQSGQLDTQRLSALGTIDTSQAQAQKEAETAKKEATTATETAQNKALSTAQDIQKKNRNVLRALGILSSSAGGEMLTKPMTEYGTQSAELQQGLVDRLAKVEDWWMTRQTEFAKAKTDLESQYAALKENISRDLRFNDTQRATAVKAASAALQQRMTDIKNQAVQYQTAAQQYSNSVLLQIAQIKMYQNPSADVSAIYNTLLSQAQGSMHPQQVSIYQTEDQRKKLLGSA